MNHDLSIRPATATDFLPIADIYAGHVMQGTGTFETEPPDQEEMARRIAAVRQRGLPWFVAERDGELLGFAYAGPFRTRPAYDWIVEDSIYVRIDRVGQGIGSALLGRVLDCCTALGYRQMVALIGGSANAASIALHRRFGFEQVGAFTSVGWKCNRWLDVVFMQRPLGPGDSLPVRERPDRRTMAED